MFCSGRKVIFFSPSDSSFSFFVAMASTCYKKRIEREKKLSFFRKLVPALSFTNKSSAFQKANIVIIDALHLPHYYTFFFLPLTSCPVASHSKWGRRPLLPQETVLSDSPCLVSHFQWPCWGE